MKIGEIICKNCGMVLEERIIDETPEWRSFAAEANTHAIDPCRVGGPIDQFAADSGMNLKLIGGNPKHSKMVEMSQKTSQEPGDKSLMRGFTQITEFATHLELTSEVVDKCKNIYGIVEKEKKLKGRSVKAVVAAIIYVASKLCKKPKKKEGKLFIHCKTNLVVIRDTQTKKREVLKCISLVRQFVSDSGTTSEDIVTKLCNNLQLPGEFKKNAITVMTRMSEKGILGGTSPYTRAGVAIYLLDTVTKRKLSWKNIANIATKEATLKSQYRKAFIYRDILCAGFIERTDEREDDGCYKEEL